jgi:Winged helix-turn-helix DNA-binding
MSCPPDLRAIARALGGKPTPSGFVCSCPLPTHGKRRGDKNPSLSIGSSSDGDLLLHCKAGCNSHDIFIALRDRGLLGETPERRVKTPPHPTAYFPTDPVEPDRRALELWRSARPIHGTLAETYLRARHITIALPPTLRGGGSTMNEFDGNLTLWNEDGVIELSHNKVRGPEFEPMNFRIEKIGSPEILDNKDRQPLLPVLRPISAADAADREKVAVNKDVALLKAMAADPSTSIRDLAEATKASKTAIARALDRLAMPKGGKLVAKSLDKWTLTAAGLKAIEGRL